MVQNGKARRAGWAGEPIADIRRCRPGGAQAGHGAPARQLPYPDMAQTDMARSGWGDNRVPLPRTAAGCHRFFRRANAQKGQAKLGHKDLAGSAELPRKAGAKSGMKHMACFPVLKTTGNGHGQDNPASRRHHLRSRSRHLASAQVRQLACCSGTVFRLRNGGRCSHSGSDEVTGENRHRRAPTHGRTAQGRATSQVVVPSLLSLS
jgi:hypothetical protein